MSQDIAQQYQTVKKKAIKISPQSRRRSINSLYFINLKELRIYIYYTKTFNYELITHYKKLNMDTGYKFPPAGGLTGGSSNPTSPPLRVGLDPDF